MKYILSTMTTSVTYPVVIEWAGSKDMKNGGPIPLVRKKSDDSRRRWPALDEIGVR